jgi:hypothetical protein
VGIEWFRDLVICIWGFLAIVFIVIIAILIMLLYRRLQKILNAVDTMCTKCNSILDSVENTTTNLQSFISSLKEEIMNPLAQIMAVFQGIRQFINIFTQFKKKAEVSEDGK